MPAFVRLSFYHSFSRTLRNNKGFLKSLSLSLYLEVRQQTTQQNGARLGLRSYEQERVRAALGSDGEFALR